MVITHHVLPSMLLIPTFQTILIQKCSLTCPADGKWRTDFQRSDVTSSVQPPYCSQISITMTNSQHQLSDAFYLLGHYIYFMLLNCTTILLSKNYYPYLQSRKMKKRVRNFHIAPYCCGIQNWVWHWGLCALSNNAASLLLLVVLGNGYTYKPVSSNKWSARMQGPHLHLHSWLLLHSKKSLNEH